MKKFLAFTCRNKSHILAKSFLYIFLIFISATLTAQQKIIQLYNGAAPGSEKWTWSEKETNKNVINTRIAYNVTHPTLTVFSPDPAIASGTAVIICPGGGFHFIMVDYEGTNVARELNKKGITVFFLKYRLVHSLTDDPWQEMMNSSSDSAKFYQEIAPVAEMAAEDTKAAITYVLRKHPTNTLSD